MDQNENNNDTDIENQVSVAIQRGKTLQDNHNKDVNRNDADTNGDELDSERKLSTPNNSSTIETFDNNNNNNSMGRAFICCDCTKKYVRRYCSFKFIAFCSVVCTIYIVALAGVYYIYSSWVTILYVIIVHVIIACIFSWLFSWCTFP
jgi:hypothetical protein